MDSKEKTCTCTCTVHNCNRYIDPTTNLQPGGRPVTQRTLRQHISDELKFQRAQEAEETRTRVLRQQEEDLVKAVEKIDLGSETVPHYETRTQNNSRTDRVKRMVSAISDIADKVSILHKDLDAFPRTPSLSPALLFSRLDDIASFIDQGIQLKVDLDLVKKRTKASAALALHRETYIKLNTFMEEAQRIQQSLKEEQQGRAEETEAAMSDPNAYISGQSFVSSKR